jgi:hypothetical protein
VAYGCTGRSTVDIPSGGADTQLVVGDDGDHDLTQDVDDNEQ